MNEMASIYDENENISIYGETVSKYGVCVLCNFCSWTLNDILNKIVIEN